MFAAHFAHEIAHHINRGGDFEFTAGSSGIGFRIWIATATGKNEGDSRAQSNATRDEFDEGVWDSFVQKLYYTSGKFDDPDAYKRLGDLVSSLRDEHQIEGNILFYMATPPVVFGMISSNLEKAGFKKGVGWRRLIVEKPFGHDLESFFTQIADVNCGNETTVHAIAKIYTRPRSHY